MRIFHFLTEEIEDKVYLLFHDDTENGTKRRLNLSKFYHSFCESEGLAGIVVGVEGSWHGMW